MGFFPGIYYDSNKITISAFVEIQTCVSHKCKIRLTCLLGHFWKLFPWEILFTLFFPLICGVKTWGSSIHHVPWCKIARSAIGMFMSLDGCVEGGSFLMDFYHSKRTIKPPFGEYVWFFPNTLSRSKWLGCFFLLQQKNPWQMRKTRLLCDFQSVTPRPQNEVTATLAII